MIKSEKLIKQTKEMLNSLGFIASGSKWSTQVCGKIMLEKWLKEINSNNPKNIKKLQEAYRRVM